MTRDNFVAWHARMGYTYVTGAAALGVSRASYANYLSGVTASTGRPMVYSRTLALACAALEAEVNPLGSEKEQPA